MSIESGMPDLENEAKESDQAEEEVELEDSSQPDIRKKGKVELDRTIEMGPQPVLGDTTKLKKRKKISSQTKRNYLLIPEDFKSLKQSVSFKFKNLDYKEAMMLMGKIGEINILLQMILKDGKNMRFNYE